MVRKHLQNYGFCLIVLVFLATACSTTFSPFPKTEEHIVGSGDTLYSIAFEHDLDYRDLADWNGIKSPYRIYTGQMLVLHEFHPLARESDQSRRNEKVDDKPRQSNVSTKPLVAGEKQTNRASQIREIEVKPAPPPPPAEETIVDKKDSGTDVVPPSSVTPPTQVAKASPPGTAPKPVTKQKVIPKYDDPWIWPIRGSVIEKFSTANKGLNISGQIGEPIKATAGGKVVYAGEGLKGYGLLLIVKHDQNYLSAYGHNDRLLVVQGENVKQGQHIATVGRGPENRSMLHFEIRRNGKPVDPEKLLPE